MPDKEQTAKQYAGVMVSSTFNDLQEHRAALMDALRKQELHAIGMETKIPETDDDVISASLRMVRESSAYIGLISHRYGQIKEDAERNEHGYSVTRLEYEEAKKLGLPILIFIMGDDHDVKKSQIETDAHKIQELEAFKKEAKDKRIYVVFESIEDFKSQVVHYIEKLHKAIEKRKSPPTHTSVPEHINTPRHQKNHIPSPPHFYAEPRYLGSHQFVGRRAELERLDDWAVEADPHPVLLFEAIGGTGKSMLTWEWTRKHALKNRAWTGCFWYSFYERGAVMADFCRHALAYMTGEPLDNLKKKKTPEMTKLLLQELQTKPWLLILDGLERVLVAYNRIDAAQLRDEELDTPVDAIIDRDPCNAIRPEDDELLRLLATAAPSKILVSTRLTPRILLNSSGLVIPGVLRVPLPGLRPADAEELFCNCGIKGDGKAIQAYLKTHCDCHPLVIGVLAGLVNNYLPDRGNFGAWAANNELNLADLDLTQKRNHILGAALNDLPDKSRELLSTLAMLSESVDYPMLAAFNPHLPPEPQKVPKPKRLESLLGWSSKSEKWKKYEEALQTRLRSPEYLVAPQKLTKTVKDLESRGFIQYDANTRHYDLHPVVRGVAAGGLQAEEKNQYGQQVVDYFSQKIQSPYEEAETLEDLSVGIQMIQTLLKMGRYQEACNLYGGGFADALLFNLEANEVNLSLLKPFFNHDWTRLPAMLKKSNAAYLTIIAGNILNRFGQRKAAIAAYAAGLGHRLEQEDWANVRICLNNIATTLSLANRFVKSEQYECLCLELAKLSNNKEGLFRARLNYFSTLVSMGKWKEAEEMWQSLDAMGRSWGRNIYRPGGAEYPYCQLLFQKGDLKEKDLAHAEKLAAEGRNRQGVRSLWYLRGEWHMEQQEWAKAAHSFQEAIRMAREVGIPDEDAETQLALARFHLGQLDHPIAEAERLSQVKDRAHVALAQLWLLIGNQEQAQKHALEAYTWAWADGEPYVRRYYLNKAMELLEELNVAIPKLAPYDPEKDEKIPLEDELRAAIARLRAEKEGKS